jgi:hypothetical protein
VDAPNVSIRIAAALLWLNGAGFGAFAIPGIIRLVQHREIPVIFGFPAYGGGPFERAGIKTSIPLLVGFLLVNVLLVVAGVFLWNGARSGAILTLTLLIPAGVYWWGFALPFGPVLGLASIILLAVNLSHLH